MPLPAEERQPWGRLARRPWLLVGFFGCCGPRQGQSEQRQCDAQHLAACLAALPAPHGCQHPCRRRRRLPVAPASQTRGVRSPQFRLRYTQNQVWTTRPNPRRPYSDPLLLPSKPISALEIPQCSPLPNPATDPFQSAPQNLPQPGFRAVSSHSPPETLARPTLQRQQPAEEGDRVCGRGGI